MTTIDKIRAEIERRLSWRITLEARAAYNNILRFLDTLPEQPVEETPEPYTGIYDEAYLQDKIARATKSWKGVDTDKMLAECRGYEQPVGKTCKTCGFYENNCPFIRDKFIPYPNKVCKDYTYSVMKAQAQLAEGLNEEIVNYYGNIPDDKDKIESARHFAEWQKGNIKNLLKSWAENELDEHPNKNDDFRLAIYSLIDKLNDL